MTIPKFREVVWKHYKEHGRHSLPWRTTHDPYRILVSEVMLQQTQIERVLSYYREWIKAYPTVKKLADAPLADVLTHWQGLGYNRRAKMLHDAAKAVVRDHKGRMIKKSTVVKMPVTVEKLESLPGVGHYTARAVAAFAYNQDVVFIETNIRTAVTHHFFKDKEGVADAEIFKVLERALSKGSAREWYAALMDYGAHLKRSGVRINNKSKTYAKQSTFAGSGREVRGAIVRELTTKPATLVRVLKLFDTDRAPQIHIQLEKLLNEGIIEKLGRLYRLPI
ncbi:MAG: A/G-specific adenine glycosylase [Parcubacteria group bacterium]|nr:A/G-specific adenine glycosylase [Parcubacteria group bacterium]